MKGTREMQGCFCRSGTFVLFYNFVITLLQLASTYDGLHPLLIQITSDLLICDGEGLTSGEVLRSIEYWVSWYFLSKLKSMINKVRRQEQTLRLV